jgi:hypothetical protein
LELGRRLRERGKIRATVETANVLAAISFTIDFKNRAKKQFGRKLFDCEPNGGGHEICGLDLTVFH